VFAGKGAFFLDGIAEIGSVTFTELKSKLELRFGEGIQLSSIISNSNRRQKFGEDFSTYFRY